ncbi:MAG: zinc-ribbon domain-containing protein [Lachnospiraceae bacterium]|nr:zinc-ribbon domain-containing protein [Lachnospiraceae bacterium]
MYCGKCGAENEDGAKFCRQCGQPLQASMVNSASQNAISGEEAKQKMNQILVKLKALPKIAWIICGCLLLGTIVFGSIVSKAAKVIKLDKYLTFEASGYDGYGSVSAVIDWDGIQRDYGKKVEFTALGSAEYGKSLSGKTPVDVMESRIHVRFDRNTDLANGEELTYTWDIDDSLGTFVIYQEKHKDGTYTVTGLTELDTFDAFSDLEVEFSGIAPDGKLYFKYDGVELQDYDFSCNKSSGLSNGDKVVITFDKSKVKKYAEKYGKVPEALEKEYTVTGLISYVNQLSELDAESLELMKAQAEDVFAAYVAKDWASSSELVSLDYVGECLLIPKSTYAMSRNYLYLVYKVSARNFISNENGSFDQISEIYWFIDYSNLTVDEEGKVNVDVTSYSTPNAKVKVDSHIRSGWDTACWYYHGYVSLDELYKALVTSNLDEYTHEENFNETFVQ